MKQEIKHAFYLGNYPLHYYYLQKKKGNQKPQYIQYLNSYKLLAKNISIPANS